jgi:putative FmdB family regulatory protein
MPLYEYRCKGCAHLEEFLQKVSDPAPLMCPACGQEHTLEKQVSLGSFQLKGGGWYKDLYSSTKSDSTASSTKGEAASSTKGETASSTKSDASAAPAAKSESAPAAAKTPPAPKTPSSPKAA